MWFSHYEFSNTISEEETVIVNRSVGKAVTLDFSWTSLYISGSQPAEQSWIVGSQVAYTADK